MSRWNEPSVVGGFATGAPNLALIDYVRAELHARGPLRVLDVGCGAARNAAPIAALGCPVIGTDAAPNMLMAARERLARESPSARVLLLQATMDRLPLRDRCAGLVIAHGIWNLARTGAEFREALREAARCASPGAGLFVFTFSRSTLAAGARPVGGETFVFSDFSGEPQCFLTEAQLLAELAAAGFERDPPGPLGEHNRPRPGALTKSGPVIWEATFRRS